MLTFAMHFFQDELCTSTELLIMKAIAFSKFKSKVSIIHLSACDIKVWDFGFAGREMVVVYSRIQTVQDLPSEHEYERDNWSSSYNDTESRFIKVTNSH